MTSVQEPTLLRDEQLNDAGQVLGRAFHDDPLNLYIFPDEEKRRRVLPWMLGTATHYAQRHNEVYTTPDRVDGAAVWLPPDGTSISSLRMLMVGMWRVPFKAGLGPMGRFMRMSSHLDNHHEHDVQDRHWYLMILGVEPERQGQGIGGALIQPILRRADGEGLPCYLETMKEINVTFYRRHGFDVISEGDIPDVGGPHYWTMRRDPRS